MQDFDSFSLPAAVRSLFELNHYRVDGPVQIHGAEIDLVARSLSDPFAAPIYIEVTVEYVDNDKYGKDVGKLAMMVELEPDCQRLIVSSKGFSLPVTERAQKSRIRTLTYDDLFRRFERFDHYVTALSGGSDLGKALASLNAVYEEPNFHDSLGEESATSFLTIEVRIIYGQEKQLVAARRPTPERAFTHRRYQLTVTILCGSQ
jgi:hypothetical protein